MPELLVPEFVDNRYQVLNINGHNPPETTLFARDLRAKDPNNDKAIIKYFPPEHEHDGEIFDFLQAYSWIGDVNLDGSIKTLEIKNNWIAFEYLQAQSLFKDIVFDKPLSVDNTLEVCKKIAVVLDEAQKNEILHMALNPRNVYLLKDGSVRIKDWLVDEEWLTLFSDLTEPYYFQAPEVLDLKPSGYLSDIYSIGILAAFLVTGEWEIKFKLDEVELPKPLSNIIHYFIDVDPSKRIQSWKEAVVALDGGRFVPVMKVDREEKAPEAEDLQEEDSVPDQAIAAAAAAIAVAKAPPKKVKKEKKDKPPREPVIPKIKEKTVGVYAATVASVKAFSQKVNWRLAGVFAVVALSVALVVVVAYALPVIFGSDADTQVIGEVEMQALPSLVGLSFEEAELKLTELGCSVEKLEEYSEEVGAGIVISQDPGDGNEISEALAVTLVVSKGQEPAAEDQAEASEPQDNTSSDTSGDTQPTDDNEPAPAPPPEPAPTPGQRPVASFTMSPSSGPSSGVFVSFNAGGSYDPDGGSIVSYSWSFGASGVSAGHEFTSAVAPTSIAITLTVTDDEGQSSSVTKSLSLY